MGDLINSITQGFTNAFTFGEIGLARIILTLGLAFIIGLYIYFIYRKTFAGVMYSRNFGSSLVLMCMISSAVILPITANLSLSLGMVGALSIVRFRTAVKDPIDTMYMFWAIAAGITLGARFYLPGLLVSLIIGILALILSSLKFKTSMPYILVLRYAENSAAAVHELLKRMPEGRLKSKTVTQAGVELTLETRLKSSDMQIVERFLAIPGVYDAALISYSGDIVA
jgi:membrane protein implicated in regulation of membrane protease activity